jgi:outer membrane protein TolC
VVSYVNVAEFEVTKARVEAMRAETDLEKARGQLETARASLNLLLEKGEDSPICLDGSLFTPSSVSPLEEFFALAEEQNPLLAAQRRTVAREKLNFKLVKASLIPDLSINPALGEDLKERATGPATSLTFSFPL